MSNRYIWTVIILIAAIFLMIGRGACGTGVSKKTASKKTGEEAFFKKTSLAPVSVTAFVVNSRDVPLVINKPGKTESSDRYQAKAPGDIKVQRVFVEEGGRVQAGDPLIKFDDETVRLKLNLARAEIREAEAELAGANANVPEKTREQPEEEGKISEPEVVGGDRTNLYQAKLERAKAEVELYEKASDLDQLNSPIAGIVTKREISEGSDASEKQVLLEVVKLDPIYFTFTVPLDVVTAIEKDAEITVKFPAFGAQEFTGEVAVVGTGVEGEGEASLSGGGVPVKLKIPNPDVTLKSEMKGTVVIRTQSRRKIMPVPETAIVRGEKPIYVYRIDGGKAKKTVVELGDPFNGQPTVTKGLSEGDTIVATSEEDLKDGAPVEVQTTKAAER